MFVAVGLSSIIEDPIAVPYVDIPNFPHSTVQGHGTELVFGKLGGKQVVAQRGRFHYYEGYNMHQVTIAVRVFAALGAKIMIATNAAGGVNPLFNVGDVMIIKDHISLPCLAGNHPLIGPNDNRFGPRFPAVNNAYNVSLRDVVIKASTALNLSQYIREGTYFHDSGPSYESPMEIHAMRVLGGDAVGMSTVPEVIVAVHSGMTVLGLSLITNKCVAPGDKTIPPSHEEVLAATDQRAKDMQALVAKCVELIPITDFATPAVSKVFDGSSPVTADKHSTSSSSSAHHQDSNVAFHMGIIGGIIGGITGAVAATILLRKHA